ncbi:MAG TPA: hypothetical protein DD381_04775 [Lentisphaeria bacterium]|nr:MAG: hypothetical protein A2X47_01685 [Lentisphaerae bacterium GWF2_38_69]HBM15645.1 hypothetical protein [Lentisphaeria bacterium]
MRKIIASGLLFIWLFNLSAAAQLSDYLYTENTYLVAFFNTDSIRESDIYSSIKSNLPVRLINNDIVATYYPEAARKGITEKDLSEAILTIDIIQDKPLMKENISYVLAIKLKKDLSKQTLAKILTASPSGVSEFTTKQLTVSLMRVIEITSERGSMYVYMPDTKTIFASDDLNAMVRLNSRYKGKAPIPLPERLLEQKKIVDSDSAVWVVGAVPPAVRSLLEVEEGKVLENDQSQDIVHLARIIIKNLIGMTLTVKASDTINVKSVALFMNQNSAKILNSLIIQYMPLLKLQIFMMTKDNTEIPFLNTIKSQVEANDCILTFYLTKDDMKGVMNLSSRNQTLGSSN